jgi:CheY-like chemotaxis protein
MYRNRGNFNGMIAQAPKKILVVDDDRDQVTAMSGILESLGYQTVVAFDGNQALERYKAEQPDLILLDVAMPGMNGFEVAAEVRRLEGKQRRTVIIIVTAFSTSFYVSASIQNDIDSHLTKPLNIEELIDHVKLMLHQ